MSRLNELDAATVQATQTVAKMLFRALKDNGHLNDGSLYEKPICELLTTVLSDEADNYPCHDYIGEALHRRIECAQYISRQDEQADINAKQLATVHEQREMSLKSAGTTITALTARRWGTTHMVARRLSALTVAHGTGTRIVRI